MITLFIILLALGILVALVLGVAVVLLDPIICILIIWGLFKLISKLCGKRTSKKK